MRPKIYLSGPITKGDREANFTQACDMQRLLMARGMAVLNPMLSMKMPGAWDIDHVAWIDNDLPWVSAADAVLRLPGESTGADVETAHAMAHGVPVFTSAFDLIEHFKVKA